jgi:hypothetical protein
MESTPASRVGDGTRWENFVYGNYRQVAKEYQAKTGIDVCSRFIENGGNAPGFDAYTISDYRPELCAVEMKNLDTYYTIGRSWLDHTLYNKDDFNGLESDYIFAIIAGGNFNQESMDKMQTDPRTKLRQITTKKINSDDELMDEKLIKSVRAVCWEIIEYMFGNLPSVYFLNVAFDWKNDDKIHLQAFSRSTYCQYSNTDPPT